MPVHRKKSDSPLGHPTAQNTLLSNFFCQESLTKSGTWLENKDNSLSLLKMGNLDNLGRVAAFTAALATADLAKAEGSNGIDHTPTGSIEQVEETSSPSIQLATSTVAQVDCVAFAKEQRSLARENGVEMSRRDLKGLLLDCQNGQLDARIAEQERIIAELDSAIAQLNLRIDEQARILDENGQVIAQIVAINNQLIIRRQNIETEIATLNADTDRLNADTARLKANTAQREANIARLNAETVRLNADTEAKLAEAERILQRLATS